jgi:hypothetical protein
VVHERVDGQFAAAEKAVARLASRQADRAVNIVEADAAQHPAVLQIE